MNGKRQFYIAAFSVLGVLVGFLFHAVLEIWYIGLLLSNFGQYGLGLSWDHWEVVHHAGLAILLIGGGLIGFWQGNVWWHRLYETDYLLPHRFSLKKKLFIAAIVLILFILVFLNRVS